MKKYIRGALILLIVLMVSISIWIGYRYYDRYLSIANIDEFIDTYVQSIIKNTNYYREHTKDQQQIEHADELRHKLLIPYKVEYKATSGGPPYFYDTAFQYVLKFNNNTSVYLHILGDGNDFYVLGIHETDDYKK